MFKGAVIIPAPDEPVGARMTLADPSDPVPVSNPTIGTTQVVLSSGISIVVYGMLLGAGVWPPDPPLHLLHVVMVLVT